MWQKGRNQLPAFLLYWNWGWLWWSLGGALVEPWWSLGGALVEPWWSLGGALVEPWWSLGGALGWLWWSLRVALGWLCTPESMPSIGLWGGFGVALGGFVPGVGTG